MEIFILNNESYNLWGLKEELKEEMLHIFWELHYNMVVTDRDPI